MYVIVFLAFIAYTYLMKFQFHRIFIFLFLLSGLSDLRAQSQAKIDSLIRVLHNSTTDSAYVENCFEIAHAYINSKQINRSFNYADSAMLRARKNKSERYIAFSYNNLGNLYNYINDFTSALDNFEKALKIQRKMGNVPAECSSILNKGNTYFYSGEYNKAEKCYRKALQLYRTIKSDVYTESNVYNNLGSACAAQNKFEEAKNWFTKSLEISQKNKDNISTAYTLNNIGNILTAEKKKEEALVYFKNALDLKVKYGDNKDKADGYTNIAEAYSELNEYKKAIEYLTIGLSYRDTSIYNKDLKNQYRSFAFMYEKMNDIASANKYYKLLNNVNNEVFKKEMAEQVERNDMMNEFSKSHLRDSLVQASKIQKQRGEISRSNTVKYSLLLIVGVIIVFLLLLFKRYKVTQAQKEVISKQKALVDEKQEEIMDSIKYARRIQESLLPTEKYISRHLNRDNK